MLDVKDVFLKALMHMTITVRIEFPLDPLQHFRGLAIFEVKCGHYIRLTIKPTSDAWNGQTSSKSRFTSCFA